MKKLLPFFALLVLASVGYGYTYIMDSTRIIRWYTSQIPIRLMLTGGTGLIDGSADFNASALTAAQIWNAQLGNVQFVPQTVASGTPADHNGANEVAFASSSYGKSFDSSTLAITTTWLTSSSSRSRRTEADILFNTAFTWNSYRGPRVSGRVDLQRVAIHELGHVLGLDHPDEAGQTVAAVMNSHVSDLDTLASDDIQGADNLYGQNSVPANDNFANASTIILNNGAATITGYNTKATRETGEPTHGSNAGTGGHSVWWKWTAPGAGEVTVDTKTSYFDTTMGVYTGLSVSALTTIGTNDDIQRSVIIQSTLTFTAVAGTTYYIAVDGYDNDGSGAENGGLTLNMAFVPAGGTLATISTQPANITTTAGSNVVFSVVATAGASTISYQWFLNDTPITGATSASLNLTGVQSGNAGSYTVVLSTPAGTVTSSAATLTVNPAPVVVTPTPAPASSGGGGGGGAPSLWFVALLSLLGLTRRYFRPRS